MFVFDCRSGLHSMAFKSKRYGMQDSPRWRRFVDLAGHQGASFHRHFCALNKHTEPSICLVEGIIPCPQLTRCLKRRHFFAPESFCKPSRRRCRLHVRPQAFPILDLSFAQSSSAPVCGTDRSVALFPPDRQADGDNAGCQAFLLSGVMVNNRSATLTRMKPDFRNLELEP
jgi:hypothetical protein